MTSPCAAFWPGPLTLLLPKAENVSSVVTGGLNSVGLRVPAHPVLLALLQQQQLKFVITGNDRPGIVRELSSVIKHKGTNIIHFESSKQSAPNWGVPLFNAVATVELPVGLSREEVVKALEAIATDIVVDIETDA